MDTRSPSPAQRALPVAQSPAEKVLGVKELAALIVSKLTLETCADAANFQLVCKALYTVRGAAQWRALCRRLSPAVAIARARDGIGVDWYSLARALLRKQMGVAVHKLSNYRLSVDIFFRGDAFYSGIFRLDDLVDEDERGFCSREDDAVAAAPGDGVFPQPWSITSADLFNGGRIADSPFRAQAYLLRDDGAVALLASNLPPCQKPELVISGDPYCCVLNFNLTAQLSERMPGARCSWIPGFFMDITLNTSFIVGEPRRDGNLAGLVRLVVPPGGVVAPADAQPLSRASYNYYYDEPNNPCVVVSHNEDARITPVIAAAKLENLHWEHTS